MTYAFNVSPTTSKSDLLIASALNGVVFVENSRLHVKGDKMHFIYKPDGSPAGWYARNSKTLDDIFLGKGASPTMPLENLEIKNSELWTAIIKQEQNQ